MPRSARLLASPILAALALALLATAPAAAQPQGWKAGAGRVVITPKQSMWMSGYAARTKPSEGARHDLWAKALVVEDPAGARGVIVTLDVCGISRDLSDAVRDRLRAEHGLDRPAVVLACSHTHCGPVVGANLLGMYPLDAEQLGRVRAYEAFLKDALVGVVAAALTDLAPAGLAWETGRCDFAVNRRNNDQGRVPELRSKLALMGPDDHDVPVLRVRSGDRLKAVLFGYACHCTTLDDYQFSGDYAGFAQIAVERAHPGTTALFWAGCGADQNPLPRREVALAERYGEDLAAAVERVLGGGMRAIATADRLERRYEEIDLAFAPIPDRAAWEQLAKSDNRFEVARARQILSQLDAGGPLKPTYPYPVQSWRLGSLDFVFLGGEVVVDFAHRIKRNVGTSHTWVAAYCNDVMGYIPSLRVLKEGGYEGGGAMLYYGMPAPWSERVEDQIIDAVARQVAPRP